MTTVPMHIGHGSKVEYNVQPRAESVLICGTAARMAIISACAVGSLSLLT